MKNKTNMRKTDYIIIVAVALIFCVCFSYTTSPIFNAFFGDSEIFRMLGRMANRGLTPYVDFFDHKGPVIITIEQIGDAISGNRMGIFIVQIAFLIGTLCGTLKIFLLKFSRKISFIMVVIVTLIIGIFYEGGNLTEEYCLPFLIFSSYFFLKTKGDSSKDASKRKQCLYFVFYGVSFGICAFMRVTNALPIVCIIIVECLCFIIHKKWKNLFSYSCLFAGGIAIIAVPYCIYYYVIGAFNEMIYGTFIHNFKYLKDDSSGDIQWITMIPLVCCLIIGLISILVTQYKSLGLYILLSATIGIVLFVKMRNYLHYYIVLVPIFVIAIYTGLLWIQLKDKKQLVRIIPISAVVLVSMGIVGFKSAKETGYKYIHKEQYSQERMQMKNIVEGIDNKNSIFAYNEGAIFYLETNTIPCCKFFVLQDSHTSINKQLRKEFVTFLNSKKAKYIVTGVNDNKYKYMQVIRNNYKIIKTNDRFKLYKAKQ